MILQTNNQAVSLAVEKIQDFTRENLIIIHLDPKARIIKTELIGIGTSANVPIPPRIIYRHALIYNASTIMLLHNHPSGVEQPSSTDVRSIKIVERQGRVIGIPLLDSLVFTKDGKLFSFRKEGLLKAIKKATELLIAH